MPKPGKNSKYKDLKRKFFLGLTAIFVVGFLITTIAVAWVSRDLPDPDKLSDSITSQSTKIYDRTGTHLLYEIYADQKRTIVPLDQVPKQLINAVIATEDTKFYEHKGIRPLSILRAFVYGIFTNRRIAGTSTLTQQLIKNAILTNERSVLRKIKEAILAIRLEQKYTKEQILKIYFNTIPYGSTNYGVETAAQSYFGKHVSDLTLAESATLAGLPQAPSRYLNDLDALKERRNFVLRRMFEEKYITAEEKTAAQAEPLNLELRYTNIQAPHFVLYVKEQLVEKYGETKVDTGGLKVITTLDWDKQQIADKVIETDSSSTLAKAGANNAAFVAMDPKTGQILAMVGSQNFDNDDIKGKFNVVTKGKRQPGSSFKPIIYAAAFEKGYTPETVLFDVSTNFAMSGKPYQPKNYDGKEYGPVTMRQALQGSLNIPAVQTLYLVGPKKGVEMAQRLGYSTLNEGEFGLTLVLGGGEVKLLEHVAAYATFANNGTYHKPVSILKVEDSDGTILEENKPETGKEVLDPKITAIVSNVLSDDNARAYIFGANGVLTLPGRPVAVKTGTTNDYVDTWTVGYTPSLAAGVWVGNTDNSPMKFGNSSAAVAAPLWNSFMKQALANTPAEQFPTPPTNDATKPILKGSLGGSITLSIDRMTGKIATSTTPVEYIEQRTYIPAHSILYYVQKDDPRGDPPTNPSDDPQFNRWEDSIQDWIKRRREKDPNWNVSFEDPPTQYDDPQSIEMAPKLTVRFPAENAVLTSRHISTDIQVEAPRGVTKVTYKIDDAYVGVVHQHPFNLDYEATNLEPGAHTLTIIVEDDIGNKMEHKIPFILNAETVKPGVSFMLTKINFTVNDFPISISLSPFKTEDILQINLYAEHGGTKDSISTINAPFSLFNSQINYIWQQTNIRGDVNLTAEVKLKSGEVRESDRERITIN